MAIGESRARLPFGHHHIEWERLTVVRRESRRPEFTHASDHRPPRQGPPRRPPPGGTDASRALTARGKRQAQWLAQSILEIVRGKPHLLTSPITRAVSTAQPIATALGLTPVIDERLATDSTVRACIEAIDDAATEHAPGTLVIVGHNPHFEALASALLTGGGEFRAMRTGEACVMDIATPIRRSSGRLESWLRLDDEESE